MSELERLADEVESMPRQMVAAGAKVLEPAILARFRRDSGGDLKLSGLVRAGRRAKAFKVSTRISETAKRTRATVSIGPKAMRGPAAWMTHGTKGHGNHPGTPAKGTFTKAVDRSLPDALDAMISVFERGA